MKLIEFAEKYNLNVKKLEGDPVIPGRKLKRNDGCYRDPNPKYPMDCLLGHIFEYSSTRMGLVFMPRRPKVWMNMARKLVAAGFEIRRNGDWEGMATFDPANPGQARLAIKAIGARKKRQASEAQIKNLTRLRTLITLSNPSIEPPLAAVESITTSQGIGGVGGIVKWTKPSIEPPLAALGSIGMAGVLQGHGPAQALA
jgi:hypothetical protein